MFTIYFYYYDGRSGSVTEVPYEETMGISNWYFNQNSDLQLTSIKTGKKSIISKYSVKSIKIERTG